MKVTVYTDSEGYGYTKGNSLGSGYHDARLIEVTDHQLDILSGISHECKEVRTRASKLISNLLNG